MRFISKMQSISTARAQWAESTKPDQLLMHEQERRLGENVKLAIEDGRHSVRYEVPWLLHGPWPVFNVDEVTLELIRRARNKGYRVKMLRRAPPTIEVSGWAPHNKSRYHAETEVYSAPKESRTTRKKAAAAPEVTVKDAQRGVVSSRLRQRLARLNIS